MRHHFGQYRVFYEGGRVEVDVKSYILSIISAAVLCAIVKVFLGEKTAAGQLGKQLSGIFLAVTIIAPLASISFSGIGNYLDNLNIEADMYVQQGKTATQEQVSAIIKSQTEAYILDKADRMGLDIAVEVELDGDNDSVPCGVRITGAVSPYGKEGLSAYIENTLGITKEKQTWN